MAHADNRSPAAVRIKAALERSPECQMDELVMACPDLTWNQVFSEVDRMSRTGDVRLMRSGGVYLISLPAKDTKA